MSPSTGENIVRALWPKIDNRLNQQLVSLRLWETANNRFTSATNVAALYEESGGRRSAATANSSLDAERWAFDVFKPNETLSYHWRESGNWSRDCEKLAANDVTATSPRTRHSGAGGSVRFAESQCANVVRLIHDLAVSSGVSDLIDEVGKHPVRPAGKQRGHRHRKALLRNHIG